MMRDTFEIIGLSAAISLTALTIVPSHARGNLGAQDARGESTVTVQAANASLSAMVENWERPAEDMRAMQDLAALSPMVPPAPASLEFPNPTEAMLNVTPPSFLPLPSATMPMDQNPPETNVDAPAPLLSPKSSIRPPKRPDPNAPKPPQPSRSTAKAAPVASAASPSRSQQRAAGSGNGAQAGEATKPSAPSMTKARRNALMSQWGNSIQARIARRAPRGAGKGTAVVRITVSSTGALQSAKVSRSSGNPTIDRLALQAVRSAGSFGAAPKGIARGSYSFSVPIKSR
ncbi:MAG: energy transducer TonB family protein [Maritimibacter sp.]